MTANAMQENLRNCIKAGIDDYLSKPIRPEELSKILAKWLPKSETILSPATEALEVSSQSSPNDSSYSDFFIHPISFDPPSPQTIVDCDITQHQVSI